MAPELFTIKKRATFVHIRDNGVFIRSNNLNVQKLINQDLDNKIGIGYTATKKIGNAVKRNRAKRRMRALISSLLKQDNILFKEKYSYVLIAKQSILKASFFEMHNQLKQCLSRS